MNNLKVLLRGVRQLYQIEKKYAILHIVTSLLAPLRPYINIYMSAVILNELTGKQNTMALFKYVLVLIFGNLIFSLVMHFLNLRKGHHSNQFSKSEKMMFAKKSMDMDYDKIEDAKIRELLERVRNESQNGYNMYFLIMFSGQLLGSISSLIASGAVCLELIINGSINYWLKILVFFTMIITVIVNYYCTQASNKLNLNMFERLIPFNSKFNFYNDYYEDYNAGKDVRLYGLEEYISNIQNQLNQHFTDVTWDVKKKSLKFVAIGSLFSSLIQILAYVVVILVCFEGNIKIGDITKYVSCIVLFIGTINASISQFESLKNNNKYLENYFKYFDIESNFQSGTIKEINNNEFTLEFDNVSFKYPNAHDYALKNVTFTLRKGERIALVGVNGSGKTTMIKLLCRLYKPTEGRILLNGIDINQYDYSYYIQQLAVVFQDYKIFSFTIAQNIATNDNFEQNSILNAINKAGLEGLLDRMHSGINTPLYKDFDEGGIEISGGESQKIAIARAIYKKTPIIILDEPTASLDPISENEIYKKFNDIAEDNTVIFISHRMAACNFSNVIYVFDNGTIVQRGTHASLLEDKSGRYFELWSAQAQYYKN